MAEFGSISLCSIGGSSFEMGKLVVRETPELADGLVVGRQIALTIEGWIEADSGSPLAAALASTIASLRVSGQNVIITEFGAKTYELLAARCREGGPHIAFTVEPGNARRRLVKAEVSANTGIAPGEEENGGTSSTTTRYTTEYGPDDRRRVQQRGEIRGPAATAVFAQVRSGFKGRFNPVSWVIKASIDETSTSDRISYTLTAEEMTDALPAVAMATAHDGTGNLAKGRDAQGEIRETLSHDLLISGDGVALCTALRLEAEAIGPILEESIDLSRIRERRLRCSFTVLRGDGNDLLAWEVDVEATQESGGARVVNYEGVRSIVVVDVTPIHRLSVRVRAVGLLRYPRIALPAIAGGFVEESPQVVRRRRVDNFRRETTLSWTLISPNAYGAAAETELLRSLRRPAAPQFYTDPEGP